MKTREEYLRKFKRLVNEYVSPYNDSVEEDSMPADQTAGGAAPADQMAGGAAPTDPMAGGAAPTDPMAGGAAPADPMAGGAAPTDPMAGGAAPTDPMAGGAAPANDATDVEAEPTEEPEGSEESDDDMVSDDEFSEEADEIKKGQKHVSKQIDDMSKRFERLMGKLDAFEQRIEDSDRRISDLKADIAMRNPTPEQKMTIRSTKSAPYGDTPTQYWEKKEQTSNYSPEDDNDGVGMPEYQIKQSDVDNMRDWTNISKSFDDERRDLHSILGY